MNRSGGVTVVAILMLLGSGLCLVVGLFTAAGAPMFLSPGALPATGPLPPRSLLVLGVILMLVAWLGGGAWGITTAIGVLRLRPWARISTLVFSGLLLFFAASLALAFLVTPLPTGRDSEQIATAARLIFVAIPASMLAVSVWWLYFFNKATVKEQFRGNAPPAQGPQKPFSIVVIAWLLILGVATCPILLLMKMPAMLFGYVFGGLPAMLVYLVYGVVGLCVGICLLQLKPWARTFAAYYFAFGLLNSVFFALLPDHAARISHVLSKMPAWMQLPPGYQAQGVSPMLLGVLFGALVSALILWFLITRKQAYLAAGKSPKTTG